MSSNLYEILGVSKDATTEEIKRAYRKKALRCHPDKTVNLPDAAKELAKEEFIKINNAHELLTDASRRQLYDKDGSAVCSEAQPEKIRTYTQETSEFTNWSYKNRLKLAGASKSEVTIKNGDVKNQTLKVTLELAKDSLKPMLERLDELVETLNKKTYTLDDNNKPVVINEKYKIVTDKITAMHYEIMFHMNRLTGTVIDYKDMLEALRASQAIIRKAQSDGEFAKHPSFVRNCPVLRELCVC